MTEVEAAHMLPLDAFELLPEALVRIALWGIRRQTLQGEAWRGTGREARWHGVTAVTGRTLPDDHHPARPLAPQVRPNGHHLRRMHDVVLAVARPLALR
jgi:hypothetical protein